MRPELMVAGIQDLHDARYCAAVGIDRIVLRLGNGSNGTFTPEGITEVAGWLSGTSIVIDVREMPASMLEALSEQLPNHHWMVSPEGWKYLHALAHPKSFILDATGIPAAMDTLPASESRVEWIIEAREAHRLEAFEKGHIVFLEGMPLDLLPLLHDQRYRHWYLGTAFVDEGLFDYQACDLFLEQLSAPAGV